ncbi:polyprenyl synthetase family protein [Lacticaseibacillus daqingensis]|uniref:polyprenyl synthetase family protein n=1 Tax=Lacticaseibacillus daqingensis TaxID=2486014 RepID=UPI000F76E316|nr:polyprenyl synthetase family protein [Lacticaseibacillus daqingensis]
MQIHPMWTDYPALAPELDETLALIATNIHPNNQPVADALLAMINAGGKLLRPAYCLLFSQFKPVDRKKMIALAAAVESLHTATLVHDDIIDKSATRRGLPTISAQFGQDVAVYAGDYLFVVCFKLIAHWASDLRSVQQDSASMERILNGELAQMGRRYNVKMTIDDYLNQVSGKTGQLFALACFLGAYESGNTGRFAKAAEHTGMAVGIAFQLLDDILDYTGTLDSIGKPVHEDIRQGVYSAPLILAMIDHRAAFAPYLQKQAAMTDADIAAVLQLVADYNGVGQARQLAARYTDKALAGMAKLPAGTPKDTLIRLTQQLLTRES